MRLYFATPVEAAGIMGPFQPRPCAVHVARIPRDINRLARHEGCHILVPLAQDLMALAMQSFKIAVEMGAGPTVLTHARL